MEEINQESDTDNEDELEEREIAEDVEENINDVIQGDNYDIEGLEEIPYEELIMTRGRQRGTWKFICRDHTYHRDPRLRGTFRCATRGNSYCPGRIVVNRSNRVYIAAAHNHDPDPNLIEEMAMRQYIANQARGTVLSPQEIYRQASLRYPNAATTRVTVDANRGIVYRERAKTRPRIPQTVAELEPLLNDYRFSQDMYRGMVEAPGNARAHIFISDDMIRQSNTAQHSHPDGTFKVTPFTPRVNQLFVIHIRVANTGFAAVYVLMQRRTKALYEAIFRRIRELAPGLITTLQTIVTDFENSLVSASKEQFPNAIIVGCTFYYVQAIYRNWLHCHLASAPENALWKAWALPYLPARFWDEALLIIWQDVDTIDPEYVMAQRFSQYLRTQWRPLAEIVASANTAVRTNNIAESFNRYVVNRLGGPHSSIWGFIELLKDDMRVTSTRLQSYLNGNIPRNRGLRSLIQKEEEIRDLQASLDLPHLMTVREFLHIVSQRYQRRRYAHYMNRVHHQDEEWPFEAVADPNDLVPIDERIEDIQGPEFQYHGPVPNLEENAQEELNQERRGERNGARRNHEDLREPARRRGARANRGARVNRGARANREAARRDLNDNRDGENRVVDGHGDMGERGVGDRRGIRRRGMRAQRGRGGGGRGGLQQQRNIIEEDEEANAEIDVPILPGAPRGRRLGRGRNNLRGHVGRPRGRGANRVREPAAIVEAAMVMQNQGNQAAENIPAAPIVDDQDVVPVVAHNQLENLLAIADNNALAQVRDVAPDVHQRVPVAPAEQPRENRVNSYCIICITEEANIVLIPCGHMCTCVQCTPNAIENGCPHCRSIPQQTLRVYNTGFSP